MIDRKLQQFIEGPVMLVLGSMGADRVCAIGRAVGAWVTDAGAVEAVVSRWQWPDTVGNLAVDPAVSLTVASPADYTCYQLKGRATLRPAGADDAQRAGRYVVSICQMLAAAGIPATESATWFSQRELWLVSLAVPDVFIQTPGPQAGQRWVAS